MKAELRCSLGAGRTPARQEVPPRLCLVLAARVWRRRPRGFSAAPWRTAPAAQRAQRRSSLLRAQGIKGCQQGGPCKALAAAAQAHTSRTEAAAVRAWRRPACARVLGGGCVRAPAAVAATKHGAAGPRQGCRGCRRDGLPCGGTAARVTSLQRGPASGVPRAARHTFINHRYRSLHPPKAAGARPISAEHSAAGLVGAAVCAWSDPVACWRLTTVI